MPIYCHNRKKKDGDRKGKCYKNETIILSFSCPSNMQLYSFEVLEELFNSTCVYSNYFPTLRGDANVFDTLPFGFEEITLRNTVVILEVEKRILYQLLTKKLLTATECMEKCQRVKITMSDRDIVSKLKIYWRDECCRKAAYAPGATNYWKKVVSLQHHHHHHNNNNNNDDDADRTASVLLNNNPHMSQQQLFPTSNISKIVNSDAELDMIYKEIPSTKMDVIENNNKSSIMNNDDDVLCWNCVTCGTTIPTTCYICSLNGIDNEQQQQHRKQHRQQQEQQQQQQSSTTSIHRYSINSGLFADFYLFSIEIINKGTQLNRLKNNLKGVVFSTDGIHDTARECNKVTLFRRKYVEKGYVILDVDLMQKRTPPEIVNWTEETLKRRQKTTTAQQQNQEIKRHRYSEEEESSSSSSPQPQQQQQQQHDEEVKDDDKMIIGFGFDDDNDDDDYNNINDNNDNKHDLLTTTTTTTTSPDNLPDLSKLASLFDMIPDL